MLSMSRRVVCTLAAALAFAAPAYAQTTLKVTLHSDLKIVDPIWTTALISTHHGNMVYDTLFALDDKLEVKPQMVDKWEVSPDKLTWTFTLRDGLEWHDGQPVTAEDCVASLKRWGARDALGQQLMASVGELKAVDAKTFTMVLKQPFGLVLEALGKPSSTVPFMMPKRVAETDPFKQIDDYTGSGPFIFKKDEWKPGDKIVYVKNTKYKPRAEPPSMLAGGKVVKIDRVEWIAITDPLTAVNALQQGEIDLIEVPVPDLFPMLKADKNITLFGWNALGSQIIMRFNHLHPPFNNLKARQAAMYAIAQEDFLRAQVGNPEIYRVCNAPLVCGSPYEKSYGDLLIKPDYDKAIDVYRELQQRFPNGGRASYAHWKVAWLSLRQGRAAEANSRSCLATRCSACGALMTASVEGISNGGRRTTRPATTPRPIPTPRNSFMRQQIRQSIERFQRTLARGAQEHLLAVPHVQRHHGQNATGVGDTSIAVHEADRQPGRGDRLDEKRGRSGVQPHRRRDPDSPLNH
jgi:hypothetical protein